MVNLRFHIVSIVAVFLALGVGIVVGSTVVDRGTVDFLKRRLDSVERNDDKVRSDNDQLSGQLKAWEQSGDLLLRGRLRGLPVLLVGVRGIARKPVDDLRHELIDAGADYQGTWWLNRKLRLDNGNDLKAMATALGTVSDQPDGLRLLAVQGLANQLAGLAASSSLLGALRDAGFIDFEAPPPPAAATTTTVATAGATAAAAATAATAPTAAISSPPTTMTPSIAPRPGTHFVVVSGAGAEVSDDQVAVPFTRALAQSPGGVLAAEAGQDTPGGREVFVGLLRKPGAATGRLSTVDDLESFLGQMAAVLALDDLAQPVPKTGHFGVGKNRQALLPTG